MSYMDYNNPTESGQRAYLLGIKRNNNPVSSRTNAHARTHWFNGWDKQSKIECKGFEVEKGEGVFTGCMKLHDSCPECGYEPGKSG